MKLPVKNLENKKVSEISLDEAVFGVPVRKDILARAINWQLAKRRQGTHKTKSISDISGTTKKPFAQKGTGRARQGSLRSPQFRGGATIFGPVLRDHGFDMPKKVRQLALRMALSEKAKENKLVILDSLEVDTPKTSAMMKAFKNMGVESALIIGNTEIDEKFSLAIRNLPDFDAIAQFGANVYDIMRKDTLVLTKDAVAQLEARLKW